jgi:hypothetical protein
MFLEIQNWKIKKSLKKHKKTKQTIFGDFLGKAPRRKAKQKKHIWRLFGEGPKEKTKKHKKNKKKLVGKPKRDAREIQREQLAPSVEVV